jgi:hypothetical protein
MAIKTYKSIYDYEEQEPLKPKEELMSSDKYEEVNHPPHYTHGKYEHAEVAIDWKLGGLLYTTTKHWCRAGRKPGHEEAKDMQKSLWYLNREIKLLESGEEFGLPVKTRKIQPELVVDDWQLPRLVANAMMEVAYTFGMYDVLKLYNAKLFIEQRIDQIIAR